MQRVAAWGVLVLCAAWTSRADSPAENFIQVDVTGLRNDQGQVLCALFTSAEDFPKNYAHAVVRARSAIVRGRASCEFRGVAPGTYAVSVFHDENSNGKLDTNFLGIPREGVGASNNARGHLGPPRFADAAFAFAGGRMLLSIVISYLQGP